MSSRELECSSTRAHQVLLCYVFESQEDTDFITVLSHSRESAQSTVLQASTVRVCVRAHGPPMDSNIGFGSPEETKIEEENEDGEEEFFWRGTHNKNKKTYLNLLLI